MATWQFHDLGNWIPYSSQQSQQLELAYQQTPTGQLTLGAHNQYKVDFSQMTQTNINTHYSRPIQRLGNQPHTATTSTTTTTSTATTNSGRRGAPTWSFMGDQQQWIPCSRPGSDSATYEGLYQQCVAAGTPTIQFQAAGFTYTLNFSDLTQINEMYGTTREIQRQPSIPNCPLLSLQPQNSDIDPIQQYQDLITKRSNSQTLLPIPTRTTLAPIQTLVQKDLRKLRKHIEKKDFGDIAFSTPRLDKFTDAAAYTDPSTAPLMTFQHYCAWKSAISDGTQSSFPYSNFIASAPPSTKSLLSSSPISPSTPVSPHPASHDDIVCPICQCPAWDLDHDDDSDDDNDDGNSMKDTLYTASSFPTGTILHLPCCHVVHSDCLSRQFQSGGSHAGSCPTCKAPLLDRPGPMPDANCTISFSRQKCAGFATSPGSVTMTFDLESGVQDSRHPNPGTHYSGDFRSHIMPQTPFVMKVLLPLFLKAFLYRHLFTVGHSFTQNRDNVITYSTIHLKTDLRGGAMNHGYPDTDFYTTAINECFDCNVKLYQDEL